MATSAWFEEFLSAASLVCPKFAESGNSRRLDHSIDYSEFYYYLPDSPDSNELEDSFQEIEEPDIDWILEEERRNRRRPPIGNKAKRKRREEEDVEKNGFGRRGKGTKGSTVENGGGFVSYRKRKEMAASSLIPILDRNALIDGNVEPTCSISSFSSVKNLHRYGNNSAKRICLERRTIGKEDMVSNCSSSLKNHSKTGSIRMTDEMSLKALPSWDETYGCGVCKRSHNSSKDLFY